MMKKSQRNPFYASEQYRHECEVRHLCKLRAESRSRQKVDAHLALVEKMRGRESKEQLNADFARQSGAGNRGEYGLWYEISGTLI